MGQVTVTLNARTYRLRCGDGEEQRVFALAQHVKSKVDRLVEEFGQVGNDRLMLMAALLVADEMFELRERQEPQSAVKPPDLMANSKEHNTGRVV